MKYYVINNEIMAIESGQEFLVQSDWVEVSEEEVNTLLNPPKTEEQIIAEKVIEYKAYLANTDYIVTKIAEAQALNKDVASLLTIYEDQLLKREEARTFINANS